MKANYHKLQCVPPRQVINWLLEGPAFIRYRTLTDLLDEGDDPQAKTAYRNMLADSMVQNLIISVNNWERQTIITRHNDAAHALHKLVFAASLGIKKNELKQAVKSILKHQSAEGPFQIRIQIPRAFGGDDKPKWDWVATDAPLILYALLRLGIKNRKVMKGADFIRKRITACGYPCFASSAMGKFRGPGRKDDPCPYANLIILRMLAQIPEYHDLPETNTAIEMLLRHWELRKQKKYFLFGIGTDFSKLKAPLIWYDLLHYLDTLSRFPGAIRDPRFLEAAAVLQNQADQQGRYVSGSIWTKWKGWEFCQKKEPSRWITFLAWRILSRLK